ncbi:MAG TPA: hypothetical protein VL693_04200 [Vicinamibacterales bacterium]|jgi:hypothetical protein|nr:hypothetical protein [Vicinamibacterales bacterium]
MLRRFVAATALGSAIALLLVSTPTAQSTYKVPRLPDGHPDFQGFWNNTTYTPLERPKGIDRDFFTREEVVEQMKRAAADESEQTTPGTIADVHYDFTQFGLDRSQAPVALNLRTSLIVDPADGHLPPMTEEGKRLNAARAEARKRAGPITDAAENQPLSVRCIQMDRDGPPMLAGAYNNNYQIVQSPGTVLILVEMLHDPRIIPTDGRAPLPNSIRQLEGTSRGRWDGDTLVIETTNFTDMFMFAAQGASADMKLTERFTRISDDTLMYRFTVDDPKVWTRPWSAEVPWKKSVGPIFEHACHEGNYSLANLLAGAREDEKRAKAQK